MKQSNFKQHIINHLEDKKLSNEQLDKLSALQEAYSDDKKNNTNFHWIAIVATLFITILSGILFINTTIDIKQLIGNEVASNHIKLKPLEVKTNDIKEIRKYFTELDFNPINSSLVAMNDQSLIGGRYCSIQGITAAQLRFENKKSGEIQSLYQTTYDRDTFKSLPNLSSGDKPITVYSKGLAIDIWIEKDILFALTKKEPSNSLTLPGTKQ